MAVLSTNNPNLLDLAKSKDPDGKIATVVEILEETNDVLTDITWIEANGVTSHTTTIRTGYPEPVWRKFYGGVQPDKSTKAQVKDNIGMLHAWSEVDKDLADLNNDVNAFRLSEDVAHIESMGQEIAETLFFGNEDTEPEAFTGLAPRYSSLTAEIGDNIIDAAGTGTDNASIWLLVWHPSTMHGIVPKGLGAGLKVEDKGVVTLQDASDGSNTGRMEVYQSHYQWNAGFSLRDWRFGVRIANIDRSNLTPDAASGADLPDLMFQAMELIPNLGRGRAMFYMDRTLRTFVRRQLSAARSMSTLTITDVGGTKTMNFQELPMRRCDALAVDEARVT